jgi:preprotein translocase subunit SecD
MKKNLTYRAIFIALVVLLCIYYIIGIPKSGDELKANLRQNIRLGLDLRGGSHLVVQVQVQDAVKMEADTTIERLKEELTQQAIPAGSLTRNDPQALEEADDVEIQVKGIPLDKTSVFRQIVVNQFPQWVLSAVNSTDYRLTLRPTETQTLASDTVTRAVQTIQKRIDGLGLAEATVQQRGRADAQSEIMIQMPGEDDPARVKSILQQAAVLELCEVKDGSFPSMEAALEKHGGVRPVGTKLVRQSPTPGAQGETWYLVASTPVISGRDLRNAQPSRDEFGRWETSFQLSQEAGRRFGRFTEANVGNRLAIVLDGMVRSAPVINSRIDDSGVIQGAANEQDAADLALILRSGSLPAGLVYLQETTVGPSLGADSIRQGLLAGVIGLIAVVAVMLLYYKMSGVNATIALILNAIVLLAILSYFQAVLTLPGIAGVVLTVGMAVDSNVLIFERIREELRTGKSIPAAIDAGFSRAFLTIIDTHVTTVVSCAFLFIFGSGPVKGFAVTLVIGLIANVFTAVFVSRTMFDFSVSRKPRMASLSI